MNNEIIKWVEKTGGPAFPLPIQNQHGMTEGMSLRDWYAGQALIGILSNPMVESLRQKFDNEIPNNNQVEAIAETCTEYADAMIKERNK